MVWDYKHHRTVIQAPSSTNTIPISLPDISGAHPNTYQGSISTKFILATYALMDADGSDFISKYTVPIGKTVTFSTTRTGYPPVVSGLTASITASANLPATPSTSTAGYGLDLRSEGNTHAVAIIVGSAYQNGTPTVNLQSASGTDEALSVCQWLSAGVSATDLTRVGIFAYCVTSGTSDTCNVTFTTDNPTVTFTDPSLIPV